MADITDLFYVEEKDVDAVGNGTSETIYAIALEDSHGGVVTICTSVEMCSDEAVAYQEAIEGGNESEIAQALYNLRLACSTGYEKDFDVYDDEDSIEAHNEDVEESMYEEEDFIGNDLELEDEIDQDEESPVDPGDEG